MKASLVIEAIGHNTAQVARSFGCGSEFARWGVTEVSLSGYPLGRVFGRTDYSQSNSKGSRGVRMWYALETDKRYLVKSPTSWKSSEEYFCHVSQDGDIIRE